MTLAEGNPDVNSKRLRYREKEAELKFNKIMGPSTL